MRKFQPDFQAYRAFSPSNCQNWVFRRPLHHQTRVTGGGRRRVSLPQRFLLLHQRLDQLHRGRGIVVHQHLLRIHH